MGYLIGYLIAGVICGFITKNINESKGYDGGFAWGFFLDVIGIIVVAVRPNARPNNYHPGYGKASGFVGGVGSTSYETAQPLKTAASKIAYCNSCKELFVDERHGQCPKCGGVSITRTNITERNWKLMSEEKREELKKKLSSV